METPSTAEYPAIYLREGAVDRLLGPYRNLGLSLKQQAAAIHVPYTSFWRAAAHGERAGERVVVAVLCAATVVAERWKLTPLRFEDLFEIR